MRAPHRVATWVREFASRFHGFYRDCRVITDDAALTQARLWLTEACRIGLADALGILGVSAPEVMERIAETKEPARHRASRRDRRFRAHRSTGRSCRPGCSSVDIERAGGRVRDAAVRLRRGLPPGPVPRRSRRASAPDNVAYAGKAFLCLAMARLVDDDGLRLDVATGRRAARRAPGRVSRRRDWCSTATTRVTRRSKPHVTPASGAIVADSFAELDRLERIGFGGSGVRSRDAGGRGAHPRVHRDRHGAVEVRVLGCQG